MLVYQRVSSKTIKNRDGKFSGWRKSDQLWPVHWASVELSQVSTLLQLGNRPHPPGGRQKPWRDMPRPRGRKHKHCYCCSISDAILGWKILDYSDYSYTFWSSNLTCWKKKKVILRASPLRFVATSEVETKQNKRHAAEGFLHIWVCLKIRSENGHYVSSPPLTAPSVAPPVPWSPSPLRRLLDWMNG